MICRNKQILIVNQNTNFWGRVIYGIVSVSSHVICFRQDADQIWMKRMGKVSQPQQRQKTVSVFQNCSP